MTGFHSYNKFKKEIRDLKQIYDFTYHLYIQEHEIIKEKLNGVGVQSGSMLTSVKSISHSLDHLYHYTERNYPNKLRQLVFINSVTALEVFFTDIIQEISLRDLTPFKTSERTEYPLLRIFEIDFSHFSVLFNSVQEVHERRHLQVHRNGKCDAQYAIKYPEFNFKTGDSIIIEHDYLIKSLDLLLAFGNEINKAALQKYPENTRKTVNAKGGRTIQHDDITVLVEFEILLSNFDINIELLSQKITEDSSTSVLDFTLQYSIKEKKVNIFISTPEWALKKILGIIKRQEKISIIDVIQIKF